MSLLKPVYFALLILCSAIILSVTGCEFDDPYVPDYAGSSTLAGRITPDPDTDLKGMEVLLSGETAFADIANDDGSFLFEYVPPGDYLLEIQKRPYLQDDFPVIIRKATDENIGIFKTELKGAIKGTIPAGKMNIIQGEVVLIVYVDGIPLVSQQDGEDDLTVDLSSTESNINIRAATRITVYVDDEPYSALVQENGDFLVEFVPPGIYSDIEVRLNSGESSLPISSGSPVVVKSGQTRVLTPASASPVDIY